MREAMLVDASGIPVNVIVLADGDEGDATIAHFAATGVVCVEITDLDPKPGLGIGWKLVDGEWVAPPSPEPEPTPPGE